MNVMPSDPACRMLLSIRYDCDGGIEGVEAIAMPGWRDGAVGWSDPDATQPTPSFLDDDEVTLLEIPGASLVLRYR